MNNNDNNNKGVWGPSRLTEEQQQRMEENRLAALAIREKKSQQHSTSSKKSTTKSNLTPPKPAVGNTHGITPSPAANIATNTKAAPKWKKRNLTDTGFTTAAELLPDNNTIGQGGNKRRKPNPSPPSNQTKKKSPNIGTATHGRKSNDSAVDLTADSESDGGDCNQWNCRKCTLLNDQFVSVCDACGTPKTTRDKKQMYINEMPSFKSNMSTSSKPAAQKRAPSNSVGRNALSGSRHPSTARSSRSARAPSSKSAGRKIPSKPATKPAGQQAHSSKSRPRGSAAAARSKPAVSNEPSFEFKTTEFLYPAHPSKNTYSGMKDKTPQNRSPSNKVVPTNEDALLVTMKMTSLLECVDSIPLNNFDSLQKCHEDESIIASTHAKLAEMEKNLAPHAWDTRVATFHRCQQCYDGKSPAVAIPMLKGLEECHPTLCISCAQLAEINGTKINWRPCIGCGDEVPANRASCVDCLGDNVCTNFGTSCEGTALFKFSASVSRFCEDCYTEDQASRKCKECGATGLVVKSAGHAICEACLATGNKKVKRKARDSNPDCLRCGLPMWGDDQEDFSAGTGPIGCKRDDCFKKCRRRLPSGGLCNGLRKKRSGGKTATQFFPRCEACFSWKNKNAAE